MFSHTYLNSTVAIRSQEALTLCSDVRPAPLKQVDDGGPAVLGVGVVLGEAEPEQSHQNEQLHVFPWVSEKTTLTCCPTVSIYTHFPLSLGPMRGWQISAWRLNRCFFLTAYNLASKLVEGKNSFEAHMGWKLGNTGVLNILNTWFTWIHQKVASETENEWEHFGIFGTFSESDASVALNLILSAGQNKLKLTLLPCHVTSQIQQQH